MFGCQYDVFVDVVWLIIGDFYFGSVYVIFGDVDNYDMLLCIDNVVKYMLFVVGGFQFVGMYVFGGVVGKSGVG